MSSVDPLPATIAEAAAALRSGTSSSVALTEAMLERIARLDPLLGAFVTVTAEAALAAADAADADFEAGVDRGPLQGVPVAVKDIIGTRDAGTTANSRVAPPGFVTGVDAPVVTRLRAAGAVVVGKATTSEYACGLPDPGTGFAVPRNPWSLDRSAGGSSSGSGIAIAAGLALGALGTDTGGSVRFPAAWNGHTGLKVTFGRVPKSGVVPLGYTLDSVGPMARTAEDCALLLGVMAGYDASDPTAAAVDVPAYSAALTGSVEGLRIGVPMPYFFDADGLDDDVRGAVLAAVDELAAHGAVVREVVVPGAEQAKTANSITMTAEAFAYHHDSLVARWGDYGRHTRMTIGRGALLGAGDYVQAQRFRAWFCREVAAVLRDVDVLAMPTWPTATRRIDDMTSEDMVTSPSFCGQWNLTGLPALAVPCGFTTSGLPLSMQLVARPFAEDLLLGVGDAYQRHTDWHLRQPPLVAEPAAA